MSFCAFDMRHTLHICDPFPGYSFQYTYSRCETFSSQYSGAKLLGIKLGTKYATAEGRRSFLRSILAPPEPYSIKW